MFDLVIGFFLVKGYNKAVGFSRLRKFNYPFRTNPAWFVFFFLTAQRSFGCLRIQSNKYMQDQQDALPALPISREQPGSTTRKRTTTDSEWGANKRMRKRLHVQPELDSPSAPEAAIHMDWEGVYLPYTVLREIPSSGGTTPWVPSPGVPQSTNANVMTPLHILPRCSLDSSTGQEERDDFSVSDTTPLPLNHLEDLPERRRLVEAYFYALPPLISLRVAILRHTYGAEPVSILGRGTPVDRARTDAWGGKWCGI
ncbi:hypothetical protein B0H14DRAFT_3548698 [Mycena olivaceomarginata]|nr:hypothetical protein B0H14DRAFT_3548698 [Mycena olivaceomarginata]